MCTLGSWLRAKSAVLRPLRHSTVIQNHQSSVAQKWEDCAPLEYYQNTKSSPKMNDWENLIISRCMPNITVFGKSNPHSLKAVTDFPQPEKCLFYKATGTLNGNEQHNLFNNAILQCINKESSNTPSEDRQGPSEEQLHLIYEKLSITLPKLFFGYHDYSIYHPDLIFINNIRGTKSVGLPSYVKQIAILRTVGHLRYGYIKFEILKITKREKDASVIVRWRIRGVGGIRALLLVWRYKLWRLRENMGDKETWYDGLSTFYVNSNGLIVKHVADKMMPDEESVVDTILPKVSVTPKLA